MVDRVAQMAAVEQFFDGPPDLDRLSLLRDDCEWWNGIGTFPSAPRRTVFRGKQEIGDVVLGRAPASARRPPSGRAGGQAGGRPGARVVDRYDVSTKQFHDVITIADGPYVFRQHRYTATTIGGRPYENH